MEFSHCNNAYFHWRIETRQWNVQGFWAKSLKTLQENLEEGLVSKKSAALTLKYAIEDIEEDDGLPGGVFYPDDSEDE